MDNNNNKFTVSIDHEFFKNIKVNHEFLKNDVSALINFLFTNRDCLSRQCIIDVIEEFLKNLSEDEEIQKDILDLFKKCFIASNAKWVTDEIIRILWVINHIKDPEYIKLFLHYINYKKITNAEIDKIFKNYIKEYYQILEKYDFPLIKDCKQGDRLLHIIHGKDYDMNRIKYLLVLNFKSIETSIDYDYSWFQYRNH